MIVNRMCIAVLLLQSVFLYPAAAPKGLPAVGSKPDMKIKAEQPKAIPAQTLHQTATGSSGGMAAVTDSNVFTDKKLKDTNKERKNALRLLSQTVIEGFHCLDYVIQRNGLEPLWKGCCITEQQLKVTVVLARWHQFLNNSSDLKQKAWIQSRIQTTMEECIYLNWLNNTTSNVLQDDCPPCRAYRLLCQEVLIKIPDKDTLKKYLGYAGFAPIMACCPDETNPIMELANQERYPSAVFMAVDIFYDLTKKCKLVGLAQYQARKSDFIKALLRDYPQEVEILELLGTL